MTTHHLKPFDALSRWTLAADLAIVLAAVLGYAMLDPGWMPALLAVAVLGSFANRLCQTYFARELYSASLAALQADRDQMDADLAASVDPWEYMKQLMSMSDQRQPKHPRLTSGGLLYGALIAEESAETYSEMAAVLDTRPGNSSLVREIALAFQYMADICDAQSKHIRECLKNAPPVDILLDEREAVGVLDGTTDIAVVNCGFALACGLPGAAAYAAVGLSNLSKANPATGKIDKDPSGKWMKGSDFFLPDLKRVLAADARG